ncbi:MAG TPA: hypothetical protein VIL49_06615 [Capillimicrobium sp.]|jgi:hypothetical protein
MSTDAGPPEPPRAPSLPEVDSPPTEDILDGAPSVDEVIRDAQPAEQIVADQPGRDELVGDDPAP